MAQQVTIAFLSQPKGFRGQLYEKILERVRLRALASAASPLVGLASHAEACASSCASRRSGTNASAALTSTTSDQHSERRTACLVVDSSTPFLRLHICASIFTLASRRVRWEGAHMSGQETEAQLTAACIRASR